MDIKSFFDKDTATVTYVVSDQATKEAAVIDSVLDYDPQSGRSTTKSADIVIDYITKQGLTLSWILETHIHADHLTASAYIKSKLGGKIGIGSRITEVLKFWVPLFNTGHDTPLDASQFDALFKDGDSFRIGSLEVKVLHTPGHTPACVSYLIGNAIFVGDTIFMPYMGTARTDFPGGSAEQLYRSIRKILSLPDNTRIFTGHDYPPEGKQAAWESTVAEQKKDNILINEKIIENEYVATRNKRDQGKPVPRLLLPSIQVNLRAGSFGKAEANGKQYVKIPVNAI